MTHRRPRRAYPPDVRQRAVAAVKDLAEHTASMQQAIHLVAQQIGAHANTIRNWIAEDSAAHVVDIRGGDDQRRRAYDAQLRVLTELNRDLTRALRDNAPR